MQKSTEIIEWAGCSGEVQAHDVISNEEFITMC